MGMVKDCAHNDAERSIAAITVVTPLGRDRRDFGGFAVWADALTVPTHLLNVVEAIVLCWKPLINLVDAHCLTIVHYLMVRQYTNRISKCHYLKLVQCKFS